MSALEIATCVASIMAIGIGILAIWLSIVFYRMTTELAGSTREAARDISASVERLEKLFDTLYADTFSMMRETVTDMRKHMWPEKAEAGEKISEEAEKKADEKVKILKKDVDKEVTRLLERQSKTDAKVESIKGELEKIVDKVIAQSRKVEMEAREETLREVIIRELRALYRHNKSVEADVLLKSVHKKYPDIDPRRIVREIEAMERDDILSWETGGLGPKTVITFE